MFGEEVKRSVRTDADGEAYNVESTVALESYIRERRASCNVVRSARARLAFSASSARICAILWMAPERTEGSALEEARMTS